VHTFAQSKNTEKIKSCSTPTNHPPPTKPRPTHQKPPLGATQTQPLPGVPPEETSHGEGVEGRAKGEQEQRQAEEEKSSKISKKVIQDKKSEGITSQKKVHLTHPHPIYSLNRRGSSSLSSFMAVVLNLD
jgi:hypothetical protein